MGNRIIDINADVGEGLNNEAQVMPFISSCNIACGGHAGTLETMRAVVRLAKQHNVKIGAHPSYPDKANFGRTTMPLSCADLFTTMSHQIREFMFVLREENAMLHHIKPHGALYNDCVVNDKVAAVVIEVMKSIAYPVKLYVPYGSVIETLAIKSNIPIVYEAFADRNYNENLTLVSRSKKNALIENADELFQHVFEMIVHQKVKTINGKKVTIKADTFCIHGDHSKTVDLLQNLTERLKQYHIQIL